MLDSTSFSKSWSVIFSRVACVLALSGTVVQTPHARADETTTSQNSPQNTVRSEENPDEAITSSTHLTLRRAILRARAAAPSVLLAELQAGASWAQSRIARTSYLPTVTASVGGTLTAGLSNGASTISGGAGTTATSLPNGTSLTAAANASVSSSWTIWDFGRTVNAVREAEAYASSADLNIRAARDAATINVATAFYSVLADREVVSARTTTVAQLRSQLAFTTGMVEIGTHAPIDKIRAQVSLDSAELDLRVAEAALLNDTAQLASTLALDPAMDLVLDAPDDLSVDAEVHHAAEKALRSRPEVVAERQQIAAREFDMAQQRAGYMPVLSATGSVSGRESEQHTTSSATSLMPGATTNTGTSSLSASIGVTLSVPLFDRSIPARVNFSAAQLAAEHENLAQVELGIRTAAVQAAIAVHSAQATYDQAQRVATGAAANLQQVDGQYRAGVASQLQLVDAQAQDANARITIIQMRFRLELSKLALIYAMGDLDSLVR